MQTLRYRVVLRETDEGFSVSCPVLPGCWPQGNTREEALENIAEAIREYLDAMAELRPEGQVEEIEVAV
ncbi:MAG: type II toxin-antitoxin system HicB family antitoxin [Dehalococcoidia bacterium]|nr:type II toxin-antitoxin system HicB family antitoxin [Dehalococcoidia bacterium]